MTLSSYDMVNRAHNGTLVARLGTMHAEGFTVEEMTEVFIADGYVVDAATLTRWCQESGVPT